MGQGGLVRKQKRLNGYQQRKAKLEKEKRAKKRAKLEKKGVLQPCPQSDTERKESYKQVTKVHKAIKRGGTYVKHEKASMFPMQRIKEYQSGVEERKEIKRIRNWLIQTQGKRCAICGLPITKKGDCTVDHIIPKSQGGKTTKGNCQLAHKLCNLLKDNEVSSKKLDN